MTLQQDPPGWNPPGLYQSCNCQHTKVEHGYGEYWQSCQREDCECGKFSAALQSPEAAANFREEMNAGLRCKRCGHQLHGSDCMWCRPVSGAPVCNYPDCGHEPGFDTAWIAEAVINELAEQYSQLTKKNPEWDRKAEKAAWESDAEYSVPEYIPRSQEELRRDSCYVVERAGDGFPSLRALTYAEVGEVVRDVLEKMKP